MNYTYKHTQFELHTECVSPEVKERMRARGFDFDADEIRHAYVVTKGGDPIKMAPVAGRPGAYRISTYVANNEWWFAVESQATGAEKMYEEVGDETESPLALETNARCVTREADGTFVRELAEEALVDGAEVSHVFGSCDYSCSSSVPPVEVSTTETSASAARAKANGGPKGAEERFHEPGYPRIPTRTFTAPVDADGMMIPPTASAAVFWWSRSRRRRERRRREAGLTFIFFASAGRESGSRGRGAKSVATNPIERRGPFPVRDAAAATFENETILRSRSVDSVGRADSFEPRSVRLARSLAVGFARKRRDPRVDIFFMALVVVVVDDVVVVRRRRRRRRSSVSAISSRVDDNFAARVARRRVDHPASLALGDGHLARRSSHVDVHERLEVEFEHGARVDDVELGEHVRVDDAERPDLLPLLASRAPVSRKYVGSDASSTSYPASPPSPRP